MTTRDRYEALPAPVRRALNDVWTVQFHRPVPPSSPSDDLVLEALVDLAEAAIEAGKARSVPAKRRAS